MGDIKYYFITYKKGDLIENDVINYFPVKFPLKNKGTTILFYSQISKAVFDMFKLMKEKF